MVLETLLIIGLGILLLLGIGSLADLDNETYMLGEKLKNESLNESEKKEITNKLIAKLENDEPKVRKTAITVLASVNLDVETQKEFFFKLIWLNEKEIDETIRDMILLTLDSISKKYGYKDYQEFHTKIVLPIIEKDKRINKLISKLNSRRVKIKKETIWTLGDMVAEKAVPVLKEIANNDKNIRVRAWATFALGQIGGEDAISYLKVICKSEDIQLVRITSIIALRSLGIIEGTDKIDNTLLIDVQNDLRNERVSFITAPHKFNWWHRQKPVIKQLIVGSISSVISGFIGLAIGLLVP